MKKSTFVRRLLVLAMILTLICTALAGCGAQSTPAPDGGDAAPSAPPAGETVATCGAASLDNQTLNYYYWLVFNTYYTAYSSYISPDTPLSQQYISDGYSWQDFFVKNAISAWQGITCYVQEAAANGFTLSGEYADALERVTDTITQQAETDGFTDLDAFLQDAYGEIASYDSFYQFYSDYYTAIAYRETQLAKFQQQFAGETASTINVRHILIQPENIEDPTSWQDALTKANDIYEQWKAQGTEEAFAALAAEQSQDPGSKDSGGLYESVYPGQMVPTFNDWCFDPARVVGDTGVVATDYGYHIMYFVGVNDEPYEGYGDYLADKAMSEAEAALTEKYPVETFTENAVIYKDIIE